eukprot:TRINITY_DN1699_c0_g1_i6.p1 TRINITY_DN1699_c0_g1~~TRINITY_DN1699_c0_g1_i6.p1  ORF type:complete len:114 (+),score=29.82 TRINITY_DN1699_c0_g1_i6:293-634(+)
MKHLRQSIANKFERFIAHPIQYEEHKMRAGEFFRYVRQLVESYGSSKRVCDNFYTHVSLNEEQLVELYEESVEGREEKELMMDVEIEYANKKLRIPLELPIMEKMQCLIFNSV